MNRRQFLRDTAITAMLARVPLASAQAAATEIAFTFDDPTTDGGGNLTWHEINEQITRHALCLQSQVNPVCLRQTHRQRVRDNNWSPPGIAPAISSAIILYSHLDFNVSTDTDSGELKKVTLAEFEGDFLRNDPLIRDYRHFTRLFRYPFFKEGDTVEKRDGMRAFLQEHGYRIGRATIDASDWAIAARLQKRIDAQPHAALGGISRFPAAAHLGACPVLRFARPSACSIGQCGTRWSFIIMRSTRYFLII